VADFLERYAVDLALPVRLQARVEKIEPREGVGFTAHLGTGTLSCQNVVVAAGTYGGRTPNIPKAPRR